MATTPSANKKKYPFDAATKQQWLKAAAPEWQGATFAEKSMSPAEGIVIQPYYDSTDLPYKPATPLSVSQHSIFGARSWFNVPLIRAATDADVNRQALKALLSGADGILFEPGVESDPEVILKDIEFNFCSISFRLTLDHRNFLSALLRVMSKRAYDPASITGALFFPLSRDGGSAPAVDFSRYPNFYSAGLVGTGDKTTSLDDLTELLVAASKKVDAADRTGKSLMPALTPVAFMVPVGTDFFFEIAKLKALRMLWYQIARAWQKEYASPLHVHAVSEPWIVEAWQPHGNLIKSTTTGMSAILGGCDALTVLPENSSTSSQRLALNVSSILREESYFSKVADATAGSYFIENLTDQIAREVWKKFQQHA